jgi:hypothetical protein
LAHEPPPGGRDARATARLVLVKNSLRMQGLFNSGAKWTTIPSESEPKEAGTTKFSLQSSFLMENETTEVD